MNREKQPSPEEMGMKSDLAADAELLQFVHGDQEQYQQALEMRSKYKNEWWKSEDPAVIAYAALTEPLLGVSLDKIHKALQDALGRPVMWPTEVGELGKQMREELLEKYGDRLKEATASKEEDEVKG